MADTFFEEEKVDEQAQEQPAETIKLGDKEYSQDELQELVGLGSQAKELESKWDTKIDRLMPEYSRSREELKTLKEQAQNNTRQEIAEKESKGEELSLEEKKRIAKEQARELGIMTEDDFEEKYAARRSGEKLLEKTEKVINEALTEGKPKTNAEELLTYMAETGIRNPADAYELMFKKQIREMELAKLQSIKPQGIWTESGSTAGSKIPAPVTPTKENLGQLLEDVLTRGGQ
jgi:hypothetical protein